MLLSYLCLFSYPSSDRGGGGGGPLWGLETPDVPGLHCKLIPVILVPLVAFCQVGSGDLASHKLGIQEILTWLVKLGMQKRGKCIFDELYCAVGEFSFLFIKRIIYFSMSNLVDFLHHKFISNIIFFSSNNDFSASWYLWL